ncbi:MAG: protease modulator HflC [Solobacterium sp.]|nr:protease modulator HflC [Solobacterium sp.]MBR2668852.1 protease modulator HflC [Solobacterium sp.]
MKKKIIPAVLVAVVILILTTCTYSVHVNEYVAVRQLGKVIAIEDQPGLHFKVPFAQTTQSISGKTVLYDIPVSDVITRDKKSMTADNFVLWRVVDPMAYIRTLNAVQLRAEERIEAAVYNALKNTISSMNQDDIIAATGERLTGMITREANSDIGQYGIEIVTSQIKILGLPSDNESAVYERMISERNNIAASYTASGAAEAQKIRNATDKEVVVLKAEAEKQAAILRAEGEEQYMQILQEAYNTQEKAEFYEYARSLDAMKESLKGENKTLVLDKNSELAKIFYPAE